MERRDVRTVREAARHDASLWSSSPAQVAPSWELYATRVLLDHRPDFAPESDRVAYAAPVHGAAEFVPAVAGP